MSTNFSVKFTNEPLSTQKSAVPAIEQSLLACGMWLNSFVMGQGSIEINIIFDNDIPTWAAASASSRFLGPVTLKDGKQYNLWQDSVIAEMQSGVDVNGSTNDAEIFIGTTNLDRWYWFDPTLNTSNDIPFDKTDSFRIGLHELLHAMGFNGSLARNPNTPDVSIYDQFYVTQGGRNYFDGPNAVQAFGGPVPVDGYHLGDSSSIAQGILTGPYSVMSSDHAPNGLRTPMDPIVIGVLRDLGYTVRDTQAKLEGKTESIDTSKIDGNAGDYKIVKTADLKWLSSSTNKSDYSWLIDSVERLEFKDRRVAIDLEGNAGVVAKILGAVFGKDSVSNEKYVGIGLDLLDKGMSYDDLGALALNAAKATTHQQIVNLLWTNVVGSAPAQSNVEPFIKMLEGGMTPGALVHLAANTTLNVANIDLVGLAQNGIEYLLV